MRIQFLWNVDRSVWNKTPNFSVFFCQKIFTCLITQGILFPGHYGIFTLHQVLHPHFCLILQIQLDIHSLSIPSLLFPIMCMIPWDLDHLSYLPTAAWKFYFENYTDRCRKYQWLSYEQYPLVMWLWTDQSNILFLWIFCAYCIVCISFCISWSWSRHYQFFFLSFNILSPHCSHSGLLQLDCMTWLSSFLSHLARLVLPPILIVWLSWWTCCTSYWGHDDTEPGFLPSHLLFSSLIFFSFFLWYSFLLFWRFCISLYDLFCWMSLSLHHWSLVSSSSSLLNVV